MNENGWVKGLVRQEIAFTLVAGLLGLAVDSFSAGVPHAVMQIVVAAIR